MELPEILKYPDPRLRRTARPVEEVTDEIRERIALMFEAMKDDHGIGLAAPQIGWDLRLFVMNLSGKPEDDMALINPEIVERKGRCTMEEGCLSLPGIFAKVERPKDIVVRAHSLEGEQIEVEANGLVSRCIQHELDHLDGILFIDRLTPVRKRSANRKLKKLEDTWREQGATANA